MGRELYQKPRRWQAAIESRPPSARLACQQLRYTALILQIAVPAPLRRTFDYLPAAANVDPAPAAGVRVRVPFGSRQLTGLLLGVAQESSTESAQLRPVEAVLDAEPLLDSAQLALISWAAGYYQHPIGEVVAAGLPKALREGRPLPMDGWQLTARSLGLADDALARARRQAAALALIRTGGITSDTTLRDAGISAAVLRELEKKGLVERCRAAPAAPSAALREQGPALSEAQAAAVAAIDQPGAFHCHLLEGVTGSGKTEVYLQLIARCLQRGEQALVLVPEIGLTPQTLQRFAQRFETPIAVLHSGLADGARLEAWLAARDGSAGIVIGTRSAVFTPLARPGLIIVDEEHDGSYKQQDGFRYSARDVAVKRAQLSACPVLLGSATPSLESLHNTQRGRYAHHLLLDRAGGGDLPDVSVVDVCAAPLRAGISEQLLLALRECTEIRGEQALLFLNRRGYAPSLICHDCGWVSQCAHCDARNTVHLRQRQLRCHHCAARGPLPGACPQCRGRLLTRGLGTEQTEEYLREVLRCPVHRIDSDSMRGRDAASALHEIGNSAEPCVLLGTQMLTKGHHFPRVQLVGVIDADALLYSADFRGEERLAQLVVQVAGRAGRERSGGRVLLQTHHPENSLLQGLLRDGYSRVATDLLKQRRAAGLPPAGQLCLLRCDSRDEQAGEQFLRGVRRQVEARLPASARLIGPLPSALPRRAGRFRWQLWCLSAARGDAAQAAAMLVAAAEAQPRGSALGWFIDIDPQEVL